MAFPKLYRLSKAGSSDGIRKLGLLTAAKAFELANEELPLSPRHEAHLLTLSNGIKVSVTDNRPLSFEKLANVLDDGRVFFWPTRKLGEGNLKARKRQGYQSEWQVYDARLLLADYWDLTEIAPINTGSTIHKPARRGVSTFAPLKGLDYEMWRNSRGLKTPDKIKEVTVLGSIAQAGDALISVESAL